MSTRLAALLKNASDSAKGSHVIRAVDVKKVYKMGDSETHALRGVTLDVRRGEYLSIMGPSGSGKSTFFNMIGGLDKPTAGKVYIDQVDIAQLDPYELAWLRCRKVGYIFQMFNLIQVMSCIENVMLPMSFAGKDSEEARDRALEILEMVGLRERALHKPGEMSGGQQQRVAIARALAVQPSILLLDEPFSALDKNLRLDMQIEVKRIQRTAGTTTILVTHDQEEALSMADRVAVLSKGKLEQFAPPTEIYDAPGSLFVNTFVGAANVLSGTVAGTDAGGNWVRLPSGETLRARQPHPAIAEGTRVSICLRPEHLDVATTGNDGIAGIVEMGLPLGASIVHEVRIADGTAIKIATPRSPGIVPLAPGTAVRVSSTVPATIFPQN